MKYIFILITFAFSLPSYASTPLVNSDWLLKNINNEDLYLLDIRTKDFYDYAHIPSAIYSDYNKWRKPQSKILRKMLPSQQQLENLLSSLGIKNTSNIIIIHGGQSAGDIAAASRVYWTLDQIGHEKKSILEGGIMQWAINQYPLKRVTEAPPARSNYKIQSIKQQVSTDTVKSAIQNKTQLIDTRSYAEYKGLISTDDERAGHITSAKALPYDWFSDTNSGQLHSMATINNIVDSINYDNNKAAIVYCHTGHRAALSWFVLHELLGNKQTLLYDGSTRDWSTQTNTPITKEIHVLP